MLHPVVTMARKGRAFTVFKDLWFPYLFRNNSNPSFLDITKYGYEQYQDIIINNAVVKKATGNHNSEARYEIIRQVLNKYRRPFTMLDIGASQGYFSFRAAHDYDCVCVMIEGNNAEYPKVGTQLLDLCKANNTLEKVILLNKRIIPEDLRTLGECESFCVVLALNIIHWFGPRWREVADLILALGDNIIVETPPEENNASEAQNLLRRSIEEYLLSKNAKIIGDVPRHTSDGARAHIYLLESEKNHLTRTHWLAPETVYDYLITSNYEKKTITKWPPHAVNMKVSDWKPGLNLVTFLMYNGAYPARRKIKALVREIQDFSHNDWTVNNMVLQGNKLILIDWDDPAHADGGRRSTSKVMKAHLRFVGLKNPIKVHRAFWNRLIHV